MLPHDLRLIIYDEVFLRYSRSNIQYLLRSVCDKPLLFVNKQIRWEGLPIVVQNMRFPWRSGDSASTVVQTKLPAFIDTLVAYVIPGSRHSQSLGSQAAAESWSSRQVVSPQQHVRRNLLVYETNSWSASAPKLWYYNPSPAHYGGVSNDVLALAGTFRSLADLSGLTELVIRASFTDILFECWVALVI